MKAVAGPYGNGTRGRSRSLAVVAAMMLVLALVLAGCGGSDKSTTGSQLDDQGTGATTGTGTDNSSTGATVNPVAPVLAGYTAEQCLADMTARYGSGSVAEQVCALVQASYGGSVPQSELNATILPKLEQQHPEWKPQPSPTQPPAQTQPPGSSTGNTWDSGGIEITVPGQPSGP